MVITLAVSLKLTARAWIPTPLQLLRDERLGRVLVRLRPLAHRRLTVGVTNVPLGIDGSGDVLARTSTGLAAQILDQHAQDVAVVDHALVVVPEIDDAKILAADIDAGVRALPTLSDTGSLVTRVGRARARRVAVVLRRPSRVGLRLRTTGPTRRRRGSTGIDAGVVAGTRTTATCGRGSITTGTTGTASATSTADATSTTRTGITALPTYRAVTSRGSRGTGRPRAIPTRRRGVTAGATGRTATRGGATGDRLRARGGITACARAVTTRPARTGTAGRGGVPARTARAVATSTGRTSCAGTTGGVPTSTAIASTTGRAGTGVGSTTRTGRTSTTRTGR